MKKIPTLFVRDQVTRQVVDFIQSGAEWVIAGEGIATKKHDGTCCLIRDGKLYKRYEVKPGGTPPPNFEPANEIDENTNKQQGWLPVGDGAEDQWHREARIPLPMGTFKPVGAYEPDGTYELCGPKVQGNPEKFHCHVLVPHGAFRIEAPRDFDGLRDYFANMDIEGIVWHHPDGRMVKIKGKDFGLKRKAETRG